MTITKDDLIKIRDACPGYKMYWLYCEHDNPVMIVARYDTPQRKTYMQFRPGEIEWEEGMPASPYPLYGLQSLSDMSPLSILFICEGEKCASVLHQLGWAAVSTVLGANNPSSSDFHPLRYYKRFCILRDNDKSGVSFTRKIAVLLRQQSSDCEIFVVNLTPNIPKGDLIDWLQSTVLRGQDWDGFQPIPSHITDNVRQALQKEIEQHSIPIEECPEIDFKPIEALFEEPPQPFEKELSPVPPFPMESLPKEISKYIALTSEQFSQTPDYAATVFIITIAGVIGRSVHLRMRPNDEWRETANCWGCLVGLPSAKKSPIMRRIFNLLRLLEERAAKFATIHHRRLHQSKIERDYGSKHKRYYSSK